MTTQSKLIVIVAAALSVHCANGEQSIDSTSLGNDNNAQTQPAPAEPAPNDPAPEWKRLAKPSANQADDDTQDMCLALGVRAKAHHLRRLIVAFEGLASFDSAATSRLYAAFEKNPTLEGNDNPAGAQSMGFVVHQLLQPFLKKAEGRVEFVVFPHDSVNDSAGGTPESCIHAFLTAAPGTKLTLIGHSYGGHAVNQLARHLEKDDIEIDSVFTVDPRLKFYAGSFGRTDNAVRWDNFYELNTPFLTGYSVPGADTNKNLSSTGVGHTGMPARPEVHAAVFDRLLN